jgi:hypothetical protein
MFFCASIFLPSAVDKQGSAKMAGLTGCGLAAQVSSIFLFRVDNQLVREMFQIG